MARCDSCRKDPCRCLDPGWTHRASAPTLQLQPMPDRRRGHKEFNARKAHLRQQAIDLGVAAPGRPNDRGRRRYRNEPEPVFRSAEEAYALLDHLEKLGVDTRRSMPKPANCPACGMETLCEHGVCLMCSPCEKCEATS